MSFEVAPLPASAWMRVVFLSACNVDTSAIVGELEAGFGLRNSRYWHEAVTTIISEQEVEIESLRSLLHNSVTTIGKYWIDSGAVVPGEHPQITTSAREAPVYWCQDGPSDAAAVRAVDEATFDTEKAVDDLERFIAEREQQHPGFAALVEAALERRMAATQPMVEDEPEDDEDEYLVEDEPEDDEDDYLVVELEQTLVSVDLIKFDGDGATVHFREGNVSVDAVVQLLNSVGKEYD